MTLNQQIAAIADTTEELAKAIRDYIDEEGDLDWSECTERELKIAVLNAKTQMILNGVKL